MPEGLSVVGVVACIALLFLGLVRPRGTVLVLCRPSQWPTAGSQAIANLREKSRSPAFLLPALLIATLAVLVPVVYRYCTKQADSPDPFIYGEVAKSIYQGQRLYVDIWQDKPPLAYLVYAIPWLWGNFNFTAIGTMLGIVLVLQGLMFFTAFKRDMIAACCCLLFVTLFPMSDWDWVWPSLEHFSNLFVAGMLLIAYVIVRDRRFELWQCALAGVLPVIAFHLRQPAVLPAIIPITAILFAPQPLRRKAMGLATLVIAAGICFWLVLLITMRISDLHEYFWTVFVYPRSYMQMGNWGGVGFLFVMPGSSALPLLLVLATAFACSGRFRWLVLGSLLVGLYFCSMPKRPYGHYWVNLFPFVAMYIGIGFTRENLGSRRTQIIFLTAISIAGLAGMGFSLHRTYSAKSYEKYVEVAQALDDLVVPSAKVLVFGPMPGNETILYCSKLQPSSKYCFSFQFRDPYIDILPIKTRAIYDDYLANPPDVLALDNQFLTTATTQRDPNGPLELITELIEKYPYRIEGGKRTYIFAVRVTPGASLLKSGVSAFH